MKELKCPKCGSVFTVDEADYASIVNQVKNAEFNEELNRRLEELHERHKTEEQLTIANVEKQYQDALSRKELMIKEKEAQINQLTTKLNDADQVKKTEITLALAEKDKEIGKLKADLIEGESKLKIAVIEEQRKAAWMRTPSKNQRTCSTSVALNTRSGMRVPCGKLPSRLRVVLLR